MREFEIRRVGPADVDLLRATRLRALADAPGAFRTTLAEAAARPRDAWATQATGRLGDRPCATWLAIDGSGDGVGMVAGIEHVDVVHVVQVWVAPRLRGSGLIDRLFHALFEWAPHHRIAIRVVPANERAEAAYARLGFELVEDRRRRYPPELEMQRSLPAPRRSTEPDHR